MQTTCTDTMKATPVLSMQPTRFLLTLLLLVTALCSLAATRPAQAQLNLPDYHIVVKFHYSDGSAQTMYLMANTQDSAGNFTGTLNDGLSGPQYYVTGTIKYFALFRLYQLNFTAAYSIRARESYRVTYSNTLQAYGWLGLTPSGSFNISGSFTSSSYSIFNGYVPGSSGALAGYGLNPSMPN